MTTPLERIRAELERRYEDGEGTVDITAALLDVAGAAQEAEAILSTYIEASGFSSRFSGLVRVRDELRASFGKIPQCLPEEES